MTTTPKKRLGDLLLDCNLISKEQLEQALAYQKEKGRGTKLGQALIEMKIVTEDDIIWALGNQLNVSFIHLNPEIVDRSVTNQVTPDFARDHRLIPLYRNENQFSVCMVDPLDTDAIEYLAGKTSCEISVSICNTHDFELTYKAVYGPLEVPEARPMSALDGAPAPQPGSVPKGLESPEKVITHILGQAILGKAERIHFEPSEKGVVIRFRTCSSLGRKLEIPLKVHVEIINKLKQLSQIALSPNQAAQVQVGHFRVSISGRTINVQSLFYPTVSGEMVILKLNDFSVNAGEVVKSSREFLDGIAGFVRTNHGVLYITGPHESGRTTTAYHILNTYDVEKVKLVTVEDPVQISYPRMTQIQVGQMSVKTRREGFDLALQLDSDVIYVDFLTDRALCEDIAFAGIGGKTVLTSFMAHDAASSIVRLLEMVPDPVIIASSLCGFLSQRLVRTLCPACRAPADLDAGFLEQLRSYCPNPICHRPVGCDSCQGTGFSGRVLVSEFVPTSPTLRQMMINRQNYHEFHHFARKEGIPTLEEQTLSLVASGEAAYDDFLRLF